MAQVSTVDLNQDPSIAFLDRLMDRLYGDPQLYQALADAGSDATRILALLDRDGGFSADYHELDDAWLEDLSGGRGGMPLALVLLAGALGSGHALPQLDPSALGGLSMLAPGGGVRTEAEGAAWLSLALPLIREFEGLAQEAYLDPVGIATIGYGTIRYPDGQEVQLGDRISAERAEQLLREAVEQHYAPALFEAIPAARRYSPAQQAALISFVYNVGIGALQSSTLRSRLLAGDDPQQVIKQELPRWCRGDGRVLPGLLRRRAAEVRLFVSGRPA